jgi:DNA-binding MarR family transcriptional regulator
MDKLVREVAGDRARAVAGAYAPRGNECAFNNLKLLSRVISSVYDEELRPVGLRASQLALIWAILAAEPVELGHLGIATFTDQTTLSRTIATLKRAGLVSVRTGIDRRVRMVAVTAAGRERFAAAMPLWESAQRRAGEWLPLDTLRTLARKVRKSARAAATPSPA